jgi:hypothetical protein
LGSHRLFFQFNPDTITRSVAARNDIQYWMNMDPIQLTQPIPGDQNFGFELLFNREAEVASGTIANKSTFDVPRSRITEAEGLSVMRDPSKVGVLADLYQFDRIIGQGISKPVIDAYLTNAEALRNKQIKEQSKEKTKDDEDKEDTLEPLTPEDRALIQQNITINVGNSAFLVANPIRIVFSSLFMVEGYVTQTQVVFNKFNQDMVPTQCVVNLSMQALYIGAAKKSTFLTVNGPKIEDELTQSAEEKQAEEKEITYLKDIADNGFTQATKLGEVYRTAGPASAYALLDNKGSRKLYFKLKVSSQLKTNVSQSQVSAVTATAKWTTTYVNNTSSKPANSPDYGTQWFDECSIDMNINKLDQVYTLNFDRPTLTAGKLLDTTSNSVYKTEVVVTFTYTTPSGYEYESIQKLKWEGQTKYNATPSDIRTQFSDFYTISKG